MASFSVVILTAAPPGLSAEAGGAFVKIDGREAMLRSIELFLNRDNVRQLQLVVFPEELENAKRKYGGHLGFSGVKLLGGGPRWIDQMCAAAPTVSAECTHVILHDAARPAVPYSDIEAVMAEAEKHPAVVLATPARTRLVEVEAGGEPVAYHLPERFMHILTPQAYTRDVFQQIASSKNEPSLAQITLLKGSPLNIRLGGSGDERLVKAMLNMLPKPKIKPLSSPFEEAQW